MTKILRFQWVLIFLGLSLFASGCATTIPLNYSPSSVLTASGSVAVTDFRYLPAINGTVAPNVIRNTALGTAEFDQDIAVFFRDAVFKELRFVGIKVDSKDRILGGEIEVVGTPTEAVFDGDKMSFEVTYDSSDKVEKVVQLSGPKEELATNP